MMEDEEGYTTLNLRPRKGGSVGPTPAGNQDSHQHPRWPLVVLGAGNIILLVAVLLLAVCVSQLASERRQTLAAPCSVGAGSGDTCTANCNTRLERFRFNLTQRLCHLAQPGPAGSSRCKLCPIDWRLHKDKCYWVSRDEKTWDESRTDCSVRDSRLLVIRDKEELESLKNLIEGTNHVWVGLSCSPGKGWAWLDGSRLDQSLLPASGQAEGSSCGAVRGNQILSESCGSAYQWICQQDAIPL